MNVLELKEVKPDKSELLSDIDDIRKMIEDGQIDCFMFIALDRDGSQTLRTSKTSGYKKAFMVQFVTAWMNSWFGAIRT